MERVANSDLFHRIQGPFEFRDLLYITLMTVFFMLLADANATPIPPAGSLPASVRKFVLFLTPVIIVLTWTRGNWLGFLLAIWVFVYLAHHLVQFSKRLIIIGLVLMLVPIGLFAAQTFVPQDVIDNRITNDKTMYARLGAWLISSQAGLENPFFGIGLNNLREVLESKRVLIEGKRSSTRAHNSFLAIFVETGMVGFTAYLAIVFSIFYTGMHIYRTYPSKSARWWGICIVAIEIGHFSSSLTSTILYKSDISHVYVFACLGGITAFYNTVNVRRSQVTAGSPMSGNLPYQPERLNVR
jgi:putative inorganic carbon (HCO3(-)) transporter